MSFATTHPVDEDGAAAAEAVGVQLLYAERPSSAAGRRHVEQSEAEVLRAVGGALVEVGTIELRTCVTPGACST